MNILYRSDVVVDIFQIDDLLLTSILWLNSHNSKLASILGDRLLGTQRRTCTHAHTAACHASSHLHLVRKSDMIQFQAMSVVFVAMFVASRTGR